MHCKIGPLKFHDTETMDIDGRNKKFARHYYRNDREFIHSTRFWQSIICKFDFLLMEKWRGKQFVAKVTQ